MAQNSNTTQAGGFTTAQTGNTTQSGGAFEAGRQQGGSFDSSSTTNTTGSAGQFQSGTGTGSYETSAQSPGSTEARAFNHGFNDYQPGRQVAVTEQRSSARPKTSAVIGSAVAAAIAGGAVPFMLAARKSRKNVQVAEYAGSDSQSYRADDRTGDSSAPRDRFSKGQR